MTRLPPRRERPRSGIQRAPERSYPAHRAFVRRHSCVVPGCSGGPIDFAHVKSRGAGGGDWFGVSLCRAHHSQQHSAGIETFQRLYGLDLYAMAAEFVRRTTDVKLREAVRAGLMEITNG